MKTQALLVAAALLTLGFGEATAQTNSESRVAKLEETVRLLELRVAVLEDQLRDVATPTRIAPEKVNWRKLRSGMSEGDVEQLLGSPSKVNANQVFFIWYYGYPSGGHVEFNANSRKVEGWTEP